MFIYLLFLFTWAMKLHGKHQPRPAYKMCGIEKEEDTPNRAPAKRRALSSKCSTQTPGQRDVQVIERSLGIRGKPRCAGWGIFSPQGWRLIGIGLNDADVRFALIWPAIFACARPGPVHTRCSDGVFVVMEWPPESRNRFQCGLWRYRLSPLPRRSRTRRRRVGWMSSIAGDWQEANKHIKTS